MLIDWYFDAYEYVKSMKRCSCRLRVSGDPSGKWHTVAEIKDAHLLSRDVSVVLCVVVVVVFFLKKNN